MIPPPNVTGSLHMGHGFQNTLMDIMTRLKECSSMTSYGKSERTMQASQHNWLSKENLKVKARQENLLAEVSLRRNLEMEKVLWQYHYQAT